MPRYIDADALLNKLPDDLPYKGSVKRVIMQAPTADVEEVKRSEWILRKDGSGTCKRCGFTQRNVWDMDNWQNFCGHCGADMRERLIE